MTSYIIFAFVSGFLLSAVIFWIVTKQLQKDWQAEYRRLMRGIFTARHAIVDNNMSRLMVSRHLKLLYDGEKI